MKKLRVTVEGKTYEVIVETVEQAGAAAPAVVPAPQPMLANITSPVSSAPKKSAPVAATAGEKDIISPLAGKVVSIDVKAGQNVAEGDQLITIEAMKMNTHVFAHTAGTIGNINVAPGDAVNEGQVLITLA